MDYYTTIRTGAPEYSDKSDQEIDSAVERARVSMQAIFATTDNVFHPRGDVEKAFPLLPYEEITKLTRILYEDFLRKTPIES